MFIYDIHIKVLCDFVNMYHVLFMIPIINTGCFRKQYRHLNLTVFSVRYELKFYIQVLISICLHGVTVD